MNNKIQFPCSELSNTTVSIKPVFLLSGLMPLQAHQASETRLLYTFFI